MAHVYGPLQCEVEDVSLLHNFRRNLQIDPNVNVSQKYTHIKGIPINMKPSKLNNNLLQIPPRQNIGGGTYGRKTIVQTNFFPLNISSISKEAMHYDITFEPDVPKFLLRAAFNKMCVESFPGRHPVFDGVKNVYSSKPLFSSSSFETKVTVLNPERNLEQKFQIKIKFAACIDMTSLNGYMKFKSSLAMPQNALQCIDVILKHALSNRFVQIGRSSFSPPTGRVIDLGDGSELWHGLFTSSVLGWKPYINIDVAHKNFPKSQLVIDYFHECNIDLQNSLKQFEHRNCSKYLTGLKVTYKIPNQPETKRSYKINSITQESARDLMFKLDNGTPISVETYYRSMKGYTLKFPFLPCLWVGSTIKKIYVPPELCTIVPGQVVKGKLTETQCRNMIKSTATTTMERQQKIADTYQKSGLNKNLTLKEFGVVIDFQFEKLDARILDPPILQYNSTEVEPRNGMWQPNKFLQGAKVLSWAILNLDYYTPQNKLIQFSNNIVSVGKSIGLCMPKVSIPPITISEKNPIRAIYTNLTNFKRAGVEVVFIIVPNRGEIYGQVKQIAELQLGVLTQCIKAGTLARISFTITQNLLLKVNAKMNGINYALATMPKMRPSVLNEPVIIIGADVTHPGLNMNLPSVVGVAGSHDPKAFQYNMCWRLQPPNVEIISDLKIIIREQLIMFYKKTNHKPRRIFYFRDGVSEGQFQQVLNFELVAIRKACQSLNKNYKPAVTMVVVQKRHHTRFFPTQKADSIGNCNNVLPGTVVDTQITHPTDLDFYLVSHQAVQGVAKPTKYRRIWDDTQMSEDEIETLTYYLCHMFSRCTKSVSYPAPTYYAHLAASRGKIYLEGQTIQLDDLQNEQSRRQIHEDIKKSNPMFFV